MNNNLISEKREAIKREITNGENRSLPEIILNSIGITIQRLTRNRIAIPYWGSGIVIALITILIGILISVVLKELVGLPDSEVILMSLWTVSIGYICIIGIYQVIHVLNETICDSVLNSIESITDLDNLHGWLLTTSLPRKQLLFSIVFTIIMTVFFLPVIWQLGSLYPRFGLTSIAIIVFFQGGMTVYYLFPFIELVNNLGKYKIRLYATDPSSSEVIESLSRMLNKTTLLGAEIEAVLTFGLVLLGFLQQSGILIWIAASWFILFLNFIGYQTILAKIITRTKRAKLNNIQEQIEKLETNENIAEQKTMDAINRLIDYHNRIKNTPNSAINIHSIFNFMNSLLLPIVGFFFGSIETVEKLFFKP